MTEEQMMGTAALLRVLADAVEAGLVDGLYIARKDASGYSSTSCATEGDTILGTILGGDGDKMMGRNRNLEAMRMVAKAYSDGVIAGRAGKEPEAEVEVSDEERAKLLARKTALESALMPTSGNA